MKGTGNGTGYGHGDGYGYGDGTGYGLGYGYGDGNGNPPIVSMYEHEGDIRLSLASQLAVRQLIGED